MVLHGIPGVLCQDPLGRIFSKCVFLNLLSPLRLPIPSNVLGSSKKLKIFPSDCVLLFPVLFCREIWGGHDLRLRHLPLQHFSCTETIQIFVGGRTSANGHHGAFLRQILVEWICTENYTETSKVIKKSLLFAGIGTDNSYPIV